MLYSSIIPYNIISSSSILIEFLELGETNKICTTDKIPWNLICWSRFDVSRKWGGDPEHICSDELVENDSYGSRYLLCPSDFTWGAETFYSNSKNKTSIKAGNVPFGGSWQFKVKNKDASIENVRFSGTKLENVQAHFYTEDSQSNFRYSGEMIESNSMNLPLTLGETLHIIVTPTAYVDGGFNTKVKTIDPNESDEKKKINTNLIFGVALGSFWLFMLVISLICWWIKRRWNRRRNLPLQINENEIEQPLYVPIRVGQQDLNEEANKWQFQGPVQMGKKLNSKLQSVSDDEEEKEESKLSNKNIPEEFEEDSITGINVRDEDLGMNVGYPVSESE